MGGGSRRRTRHTRSHTSDKARHRQLLRRLLVRPLRVRPNAPSCSMVRPSAEGQPHGVWGVVSKGRRYLGPGVYTGCSRAATQKQRRQELNNALPTKRQIIMMVRKDSAQ